MPMERTAGVDGCRAGWFAIVIDAAGEAELGIFASIPELWGACSDAGAILIDIPIGLISKAGDGRSCDAAARGVLKPLRHSSVFTPPCREALSAGSYAEACRINLRVCGRKISKQTWGISGKIKEVDTFLLSHPEARGIFRETHPEVCFWAMAGYAPMVHRKKSASGIAERLDLLQQIYPRSYTIFGTALERYFRKDLAKDDIIDALANAVTARHLKDGAATLPVNPPSDRRGLPMEMVYARKLGVTREGARPLR